MGYDWRVKLHARFNVALFTKSSRVSIVNRCGFVYVYLYKHCWFGRFELSKWVLDLEVMSAQNWRPWL